MKKCIFSCAVLTLFVAVACRHAVKAPDLEGMDVKLVLKRFEKDIFVIPLDSLKDAIPRLKAAYGEFFDLFNYQIAALGSDKDPQYPAYLKAYLTDYSVNELYNTCEEKFPELGFIHTGLQRAFKLYAYYFPGKQIPTVITFVSGLNQSIVTSDTILGIALDKYLGSDCELYKRAMIPQYLSNNMRKEKILVDCMRGWAMTQFEFNRGENNLLNNMIYQGKILYFTRMLLPGEPDTMVFGFTSKQLEWCRKNEAKMWTYLLDKKFLFNSNQLMITKFVNDAPFTKDFAQDSPGKAVTWIGMNIVSAYMNRFPDVSLDSLMCNTDYRAILEGSRYDP